tara:strand:+ start:10699 stop:11292 length:594 start_codon:yes stop_codon:yes gene_type:complete
MPTHECGICYETVSSDIIKTPCHHVYHNRCLTEWLLQKTTCPICRNNYGHENNSCTEVDHELDNDSEELDIYYKENIIIEGCESFKHKNFFQDTLVSSIRELLDYRFNDINLKKYNWKATENDNYNILINTKHCNFRVSLYIQELKRKTRIDNIVIIPIEIFTYVHEVPSTKYNSNKVEKWKFKNRKRMKKNENEPK